MAGALCTLVSAVQSPAAQILVSDEKGTAIESLNTSSGVRTTYMSGLSNPDGLVLGLDGFIYATGFNGGTLNRITSSSTFAQIASGFNGAGAVTMDASGNFYVPNFGFPSPGGTSVGKVVPIGGGSYSTTVNFTTTVLSTPDGLAFDSHGILYEADFGSNRINKIDTSNGNVTAFVPNTAGLSQPSAIVFDSADNLYVANFAGGGTSAGNVMMFNSSGAFVFTLTTGLNSPLGLLLDQAGSTFYVSSWNGNTVSSFAMAGGSATQVGSGFNGPTHMVFAPAPEPSSLVILLTGAGVLASRRSRAARSTR